MASKLLQIIHTGGTNFTIEETQEDYDDLKVEIEDEVKMKEIVIIVFIMGIWFYSLYRLVIMFFIIYLLEYLQRSGLDD